MDETKSQSKWSCHCAVESDEYHYHHHQQQQSNQQYYCQHEKLKQIIRSIIIIGNGGHDHHNGDGNGAQIYAQYPGVECGRPGSPVYQQSRHFMCGG